MRLKAGVSDEEFNTRVDIVPMGGREWSENTYERPDHHVYKYYWCGWVGTVASNGARCTTNIHFPPPTFVSPYR